MKDRCTLTGVKQLRFIWPKNVIPFMIYQTHSCMTFFWRTRTLDPDPFCDRSKSRLPNTSDWVCSMERFIKSTISCSWYNPICISQTKIDIQTTVELRSYGPALTEFRPKHILNFGPFNLFCFMSYIGYNEIPPITDKINWSRDSTVISKPNFNDKLIVPTPRLTCACSPVAISDKSSFARASVSRIIASNCRVVMGVESFVWWSRRSFK